MLLEFFEKKNKIVAIKCLPIIFQRARDNSRPKLLSAKYVTEKILPPGKCTANSEKCRSIYICDPQMNRIW